MNTYSSCKNNPQRPLNLISHRYRAFSLLQPSEMASLSNYRLQNRKERSNRSTNNGDNVEKVKRKSDIYPIAERLSFLVSNSRHMVRERVRRVFKPPKEK